MSFQIPCPNCGLREVEEFRFGGEYRLRPKLETQPREWVRYNYLRRNIAGEQKEWWYHKLGCGKWFLVIRDTTNNQIIPAKL